MRRSIYLWTCAIQNCDIWYLQFFWTLSWDKSLEGQRHNACLSSQDSCLARGWQLTLQLCTCNRRIQCKRNTVLLSHELCGVTCETKGGHHRLEELISIECIFFNKTVISYWHQLNVWFTGCNLWNPRWQMGAQWISNQKSSSIICWVPFLQFNTGFGYFPLAGEVFWKCLFLICVVQEFCFFVFEFLHNTCITSQEHRSKKNTLETKDFFYKRITSDLFQICAMFLDPDVFIDILIERFV